ncbi:MAG: hypothetical protein IKT26_04785, partial [Bacteroidaceae bacterium]|nr:hypothetical protein [Bacteroidaceae bacterium]
METNFTQTPSFCATNDFFIDFRTQKRQVKVTKSHANDEKTTRNSTTHTQKAIKHLDNKQQASSLAAQNHGCALVFCFFLRLPGVNRSLKL